jgi:prefoldin subunit 5
VLTAEELRQISARLDELQADIGNLRRSIDDLESDALQAAGVSTLSREGA